MNVATSPIRDARVRAGLTQQQAADRVGWTQSAWAQSESMDINRVSLGRLRKIASAIGCRLADLISEASLA